MSSSPKFRMVAAVTGQAFGKRRRKFLCLTMDPEKIQTFFFHFGLILLCIFYVIAGSAVFYHIEEPHQQAHINLTNLAITQESKKALGVIFDILQRGDNQTKDAFKYAALGPVNNFEHAMFEMYPDALSAIVFDRMVYGDDCCEMSSWTPNGALLFASTTVIPVGFGLITPLTAHGRIFLVLYAIVGIPLALMVTSDIGKFICGFIFTILNDNPIQSMFVLMALLVSYPFCMGGLVSMLSSLRLIDSIYYSIMCIFTIGYGDILPPIPVPFLILLIVFGVTLVTVSVELVASNVIHNVHYMGRQMSRAKEIAGKVMNFAQKINVNKGLSFGISQLNAFTRLGMNMNFDGMAMNNNNIPAEGGNGNEENELEVPQEAFEPSIALDFVDFASDIESM